MQIENNLNTGLEYYLKMFTDGSRGPENGIVGFGVSVAQHGLWIDKRTVTQM